PLRRGHRRKRNTRASDSVAGFAHVVRSEHADFGGRNTQSNGASIRFPGEIVHAADPAHGAIGGIGIEAPWFLPGWRWKVPRASAARKEAQAIGFARTWLAPQSAREDHHFKAP